MNANSFFDINRTKLLLVRQLKLDSQQILIGFGAVAGLIVFIRSMGIIFTHQTLSDASFFGLVMPFFFIGGFIFTSIIFLELGKPQRAYLYLTLPATTFEKLIVAWFTSSVLYVIGAIAVMYLINIFLIIVASLFTSVQIHFYGILSGNLIYMYGLYMVTQSVFLLGAIYFRKVHFLKTLLSLFVISVIIAIITAIFARFIFFKNFEMFNNINMPENIKHFFIEIFVPTVKVVFWYCLAPFFILVSYFRLKEREV